MRQPKPTTVMMPLADILNARHGCAWEDCGASYQPPKRPKDWMSVLAWKGSTAYFPTMDTPFERDCELCPVHAVQFDALLKRIR